MMKTTCAYLAHFQQTESSDGAFPKAAGLPQFYQFCLEYQNQPEQYEQCLICQAGIQVINNTLQIVPEELIRTSVSDASNLAKVSFMNTTTLLDERTALRWKCLPDVIIPKLDSLMSLQPFWRKPLLTSDAENDCPNCLKSKTYRGYGLCISCVEACSKLTGEDLCHELILTALRANHETIVSELYLSEDDRHLPGIIRSKAETVEVWEHIPEPVLPSVRLKHLRPFWKNRTALENSYCPNCLARSKTIINHVCPRCSSSVSKLFGIDMLQELKKRSKVEVE